MPFTRLDNINRVADVRNIKVIEPDFGDYVKVNGTPKILWFYFMIYFWKPFVSD